VAASAPFLFVATNAVEKVKYRILCVGGKAGRRINERLAFVADESEKQWG